MGREISNEGLIRKAKRLVRRGYMPRKAVEQVFRERGIYSPGPMGRFHKVLSVVDGSVKAPQLPATSAKTFGNYYTEEEIRRSQTRVDVYG